MFHNFIDFKKAFGRVWPALRHVIRSFNAVEGLDQVIQALCENSGNEVLWNNQWGSRWGFFVFCFCFLRQERVFVREVCSHQSCSTYTLRPEKITQEIPHDHHILISISGRPPIHRPHRLNRHQQRQTYTRHQETRGQSKIGE